MKKLTLLAIAGLSIVAGGCSKAYPTTEDRIENVDKTIKKNNLAGEQNDARDQRFDATVQPGGSTPPGK